MMTIGGMRIMENPMIEPVPRMRVSPEFARLQSPQLVVETNLWMREFFGTYLPTYVMDLGAAGLGFGKTVVMHPTHLAMLRAQRQP